MSDFRARESFRFRNNSVTFSVPEMSASARRKPQAIIADKCPMRELHQASALANDTTPPQNTALISDEAFFLQITAGPATALCLLSELKDVVCSLALALVWEMAPLTTLRVLERATAGAREAGPLPLSSKES
jgi:hypothetical protein